METRLRLAAVVLLIVGLWLVGRWTGLDEHFERDAVRDAVERAGIWGSVLYVGLFAAGVLLHVPGMVFVAAAVFAFGGITGMSTALIGALVSVTVSFLVVRFIGGQPLSEIDQWLDARRKGRFGRTRLYGFVRRMFAELEVRPVRSVVLLRLVFWMAPFLNYALAMTRLRLRHYVLGSALGLVVPVTVAALLFGWLFR